MMYRIGMCANFAKGQNSINGQTIKSRTIYNELRNNKNYSVYMNDTYGGIKNIASVLFNLIKMELFCKNIIIMPGENGIRIIVPFLIIINKLFSRKTHYIVVGGWLPYFILKHKIISKFLKKIDYIYVETKGMKLLLNDAGLKNVIVMPNFKRLNIVQFEKGDTVIKSPPRSMCIFSRIIKEKGIIEAIEAISIINKKHDKCVVRLDIYGPIDRKFKEEFERKIATANDAAKYCGTVPYNETVKCIKKYSALLFPTYYEGEGFPGTILDAFSSGVPVIASDWMYNSEIVTDGYNGLLCKPRNVNSLVSSIDFLLCNDDKLAVMRNNCITTANKFKPEKIMKCLCSYIV